MKYLPTLFALLLVAVLSVATGIGGSPPVHAQSSLTAPANVIVSDGENSGEVVVTWDAVPDAGYYRIGWVNYNDYLEVTGRDRPWSEAFAFVDVANIGQTSHTITRLEPGALHAFLVASNASPYGEPSWSDWALLELAPAPAPQPTPGTPTQPTEGTSFLSISPSSDCQQPVQQLTKGEGCRWKSAAIW